MVYLYWTESGLRIKNSSIFGFLAVSDGAPSLAFLLANAGTDLAMNASVLCTYPTGFFLILALRRYETT
jgi:hypothetical protein